VLRNRILSCIGGENFRVQSVDIVFPPRDAAELRPRDKVAKNPTLSLGAGAVPIFGPVRGHTTELCGKDLVHIFDLLRVLRGQVLVAAHLHEHAATTTPRIGEERIVPALKSMTRGNWITLPARKR
jgi:hypothetical protein